MFKLCKVCDKEKPLNEMVKNKICLDGYEYKCKTCHNEYIRNYRKNISDSKPKKIKVDTKKRQKEYYESNKSTVLVRNKKWRAFNKESSKVKRRDYIKNRKKIDILFKLKESIKASIRQSFRDTKYRKKSRTSDILGCSYDDFKLYIESKFENWMNWSNYGNWDGIPKDVNKSWDIDHIIPLYEANNEEELIKLNHYTNLQPLCSYTNRWIKRQNK